MMGGLPCFAQLQWHPFVGVSKHNEAQPAAPAPIPFPLTYHVEFSVLNGVPLPMYNAADEPPRVIVIGGFNSLPSHGHRNGPVYGPGEIPLMGRGTDAGFVVFHWPISPPSAFLMLPMIIVFGESVSFFGSSSVKIPCRNAIFQESEEDASCSPVPYSPIGLNFGCGETWPSPTDVTILPNTVYVGMSLMDYVAAIIDIAIQFAIVGISEGCGALWKKVSPTKAAKQARRTAKEADRIMGKVADEAAERASREVMREAGSEASERAVREAAEKAREEAAEKARKEVLEKARKDAVTKATRDGASKEAAEAAGEGAVLRAGRQADDAAERAGREAHDKSLRASREAQEKARKKAADRARKKQLEQSKKQWAKAELGKELEGKLKKGYKKFYKKEFRKEVLEGVRDDWVLEPVVQQAFASGTASLGGFLKEQFGEDSKLGSFGTDLEKEYGDGSGSNWGWWKNTGGPIVDGATRKTNVTPAPGPSGGQDPADLERAWWEV